ncbi:MAG: acyltransferase [Gammaproteobacteria bacterium]
MPPSSHPAPEVSAAALPAPVESIAVDGPAVIDRAALAESRRIQTLRGIACLLLVAFHVIGHHPTSGLHVDDDSFYRFFANLFRYVRMPLFAFLSGFVYAYRPVMPHHVREFARRKAFRLVVPLVVVSTLYFISTAMGPKDANGNVPLEHWWHIYVFPYVHYWFLQAIILIFAAIAVLDTARLLSTPGRYASVLFATMAVYLSLDMEHEDFAPFSYIGALSLAPFFLLGLGANRFRSILLQPRVIWTCGAICLAAMALHAFALSQGGTIASRGTLLGLLIGATSALALLGMFPSLKSLERIGAYSFAIFLFHPFFVAAIRTVHKLLGVKSMEVTFFVCLFAGIAGPVLLQRMLGGVPVASRLLFGEPPKAR